MSRPSSAPEPCPRPERAGVVGSQEPACIVCEGPLGGLTREACSAKCRATLSRRRRDEKRRARDQEVRALLLAALTRLEET